MQTPKASTRHPPPPDPPLALARAMRGQERARHPPRTMEYSIMPSTSLPTNRRAWVEMIASAILLPLIVTVAGIAMIGFAR